jgi:hypothetical protein
MQRKNNTKRQPTSNLIQFPGGAYVPPTVDEPEPEEEIASLDDLLDANPDNTMLLKVSGDNSKFGICDGDWLLVKQNIMAGIHDAVIVEEDGGNVVMSFREIAGRPVVGVATYLISPMRLTKRGSVGKQPTSAA